MNKEIVNKILEEGKDLTGKQRAFCIYWVTDEETQRNAYLSAVKAGYSETSARSVASENLTKPNLREYIRKLEIEYFTPMIASKEEVLARLSDLHREDIFNRGTPIRSSNIQAASELAKINGWYTPEIHEINLNWTLISKRINEIKEANVQRQITTEGSNQGENETL